jgi:hypothetical protein
MRLAPRSLFSRLMLVLLTVLVAAQLVSFAIHMHERSEALSQASGMQSAQRIAEIVKLLDSLQPAERLRIVPVLSSPPLSIELGKSPVAAREEETGAGARSALFAAMLHRFLGDTRPIAVSLAAAAPLEPGPGRRRRWRRRIISRSPALLLSPRCRCGTARSRPSIRGCRRRQRIGRTGCCSAWRCSSPRSSRCRSWRCAG